MRRWLMVVVLGLAAVLGTATTASAATGGSDTPMADFWCC